MKSNTTKTGQEVDDGRILRLWYLPNVWEKAMEKNFKERLEENGWKNTSDWEKVKNKKWNKIQQSPYVFLSQSPLTFGHSQLVISLNRTKREGKDFFCLAAKIIERAIIAFQEAFKKQKLHKDKNFSSLAVITKTKGEYIKTLILRASANENVCEEYKVHLVPYFNSHENDCMKRYHSLHGFSSEDRGGLLGWLGERETEVDKLLELGPLKEKLNGFANEDLKMAELAKKLRSYV